MEKSIKSGGNSGVRELTLNGMLIALVFIATYFIQIRLPISVNGGLIHMGNVALFSVAILLGKRRGAIAGAFGMGLFDILSGWMAWAPFTFIVRGVMGFIIGAIAFSGDSKGENVFKNVFAILVSSVWMIVGYYLTEVTLYGNWQAPITSIPGNITQIVIGLAVALPLAAAINKTNILKNLK